MPDLSTLLVFMSAALVLLITPGPAVLYIVARSIDQGRAAGIVSVLGIGFGTTFHVFAAALGISALVVSSALAFSIVKYLGAAYLIYLGIRKFLEHDTLTSVDSVERTKLSRIFYQGAIVNILNPKTALFCLALLPQFVDPAKGHVTGQILTLGMILVVMGICSDGCYALAAGTIRGWLKSSLTILRAQRYFAGSVYILLGVVTAVSGTKRQ